MITDERKKELDELAAGIYTKVGDAHRAFTARISEINAKHLDIRGEELEYVKGIMCEHPILSVLVLLRNPDDDKKFGEGVLDASFIAGKLTNLKIVQGSSMTGNPEADCALCALHVALLGRSTGLDSLRELANIAETAACLLGVRIDNVQARGESMARAVKEVENVVADRMVEEAAKKGGQA